MSNNNKDAFAERVKRVKKREGQRFIVGGETSRDDGSSEMPATIATAKGPSLLTISILAMTWGALTFAIEGAAVARIPGYEANPFSFASSISLTPGLAIFVTLFLFGYTALKMRGLAAVLMFGFAYFFTTVAGHQAALVYPQTASLLYTPNLMNQILLAEGFPSDIPKDWSGWEEYAAVSAKYMPVQGASLE